MPLIATPLLGPWLLRRRRFTQLALEWVHPGLDWDQATRETYLAPLRERARGSASRRLYGRFVFTELGEILRGRYKRERLAVPTLCIHGGADRAVRPEILRGYQPFADDLRIEVIRDAGDFVCDAAPDEVTARITAFLTAPSPVTELAKANKQSGPPWRDQMRPTRAPTPESTHAQHDLDPPASRAVR